MKGINHQIYSEKLIKKIIVFFLIAHILFAMNI